MSHHLDWGGPKGSAGVHIGTTPNLPVLVARREADLGIGCPAGAPAIPPDAACAPARRAAPHHRSPSPRRAPLLFSRRPSAPRFCSPRAATAPTCVPPARVPRRDRGWHGPRVVQHTMARVSVSRKAPGRAFDVPPVLSPAGGSPHGHHSSRVRDPGTHLHRGVAVARHSSQRYLSPTGLESAHPRHARWSD